MGYTHYFSFTIPRGEAKALEEKYQTAIAECARIARHWNTHVAVKGTDTDWMRLSGFSAHTAPREGYGGIELNGKGDESHETFCLREHLRQNTEPDFSCKVKTNRKPYDTVVTACLAVLKYRLGDAMQLGSDGKHADWVEGVLLARQVIRRQVPNPIPIEMQLIIVKA